MKNIFVPILLGSDSDIEFAKEITKHLEKFGVEFEIVTSSAHKVPEKLLKHIEKFEQTATHLCFITIAGRSNGLSGVTAGATLFPVVACPPHKDKSDYLTNIHSTLQMPSDTPVLTVCDPQNCAMTVLRILSLAEPTLKSKLDTHRKEVKNSFKDA